MRRRRLKVGQRSLHHGLPFWLLFGLMVGCSGEVAEPPTDAQLSEQDLLDLTATGDTLGDLLDAGPLDVELTELPTSLDSHGDAEETTLADGALVDDALVDDALADAETIAPPDVTLNDGVDSGEEDTAPDSEAPVVDAPTLVDAPVDVPETAGPEDVGPSPPPDAEVSPPDVGPPPVYEGTCCAPNGSPGCNEAACVELICEEDPYCCAMKWDSLCAKCAAGQSSDGACDGFELLCDCDIAASGGCCEAHPGGLCDSLECTLAVCELDPYCCDTTWDSYCVGCAEGGQTYAEVSCSGVEEDCGCEPPPTGPTHLELAEAWAPVWYHDTDDSAYEADYITAYDFDGDTVSANNWENLYAPTADLRAVIYWALIETTTHWYILYADFHPRDWTEDCDPFLPFTEPCHENDMEGAMVMVKKDGSELGSFVLLVTEAHNVLHVFRNDPNITALSTSHLESPQVTFEAQRHPELYVESKGHGVCALMYDGSQHCEHPVEPGGNPFPGGDGIVYRYKGVAEEPTSGDDPDVGYALVSLYDTLWQQRGDICDGECTFDQTFDYEGTPLAKAFDGDSWGDDKANPPWAWDDPDDGPVYRGDFFFRPAEAVTTWLEIPGAVSVTYLFNPFLEDL